MRKMDRGRDRGGLVVYLLAEFLARVLTFLVIIYLLYARVCFSAILRKKCISRIVCHSLKYLFIIFLKSRGRADDGDLRGLGRGIGLPDAYYTARRRN